MVSRSLMAWMETFGNVTCKLIHHVSRQPYPVLRYRTRFLSVTISWVCRTSGSTSCRTRRRTTSSATRFWRTSCLTRKTDWRTCREREKERTYDQVTKRFRVHLRSTPELETVFGQISTNSKPSHTVNRAALVCSSFVWLL